VEVVGAFVDVLASLGGIRAVGNSITGTLEVSVTKPTYAALAIIAALVRVVRHTIGTVVALSIGALSERVGMGGTNIRADGISTHFSVGTQVHHRILTFVDIDTASILRVVESRGASAVC
jgi:hypothetical protein